MTLSLPAKIIRKIELPDFQGEFSSQDGLCRILLVPETLRKISEKKNYKNISNKKLSKTLR